MKFKKNLFHRQPLFARGIKLVSFLTERSSIFILNSMSSEEKKSFEIKLKVPFYDLDPLQMVWHGNYLKYFDTARAELFDSLGVDLDGFYNKTKILFPITRTQTKHIFPLRYKDEFTCKASLSDARQKIVIHFEIRHVSGGRLCARGSSEQVAVQTPEMEIMLKIPDEIREALGF
jgi:acyl-CoA thioester hydrolase